MIEDSFLKVFTSLVHVYLAPAVFINPYTIVAKGQAATLELTTLHRNKNHIKQLKTDVENLLAGHASLEAAKDEMKKWATNVNPLWSQFRPLAEVNVHLDMEKERINVMIIQNKEVVQFFGFSQQERLDPFFDYLETYTESLVKKTDS